VAPQAVRGRRAAGTGSSSNDAVAAAKPSVASSPLRFDSTRRAYAATSCPRRGPCSGDYHVPPSECLPAHWHRQAFCSPKARTLLRYDRDNTRVRGFSKEDVMHQRAPIAVSTAALVVTILGSTSVGHAAGRALSAVVPFAQKAGFAYKARVANEAIRVDGHMASVTPSGGQIPVLDAGGKLPASIGAVGPQGTQGAQGPQGSKGDSGATKVVVRAGTPKEVGPSTTLAAECLPGERATGGGATVLGGMGQGRLVDSAPVPPTAGATPTGWTATANSNSNSTTVTLTVFVVCASP
jgi:hypothetical protein